MNSVLKYPGSKWNIARNLVELIPPHHSYVEPYFGSRGGAFYPAHQCDHFVKYTGAKVEECIQANTIVYQDGYRICSLEDIFGCNVCYDQLMKRLEDKEAEM